MKFVELLTILLFILLQVLELHTLETDNISVPIPQKISKESSNSTVNTEDVGPSLPKDEKNESLSHEVTQAPSTLSKEASPDETNILKKKINTDAMFRGLYVVFALGSVFLIYIGIKAWRLRRHRASNKYKVIATKGEDRESFFPLAAEDGEDEEIFSASNHQGYT